MDLPGQVQRPGDRGYDEARRVANATIDRHPIAIVRPVDAAGVARAVTFAREAGLPLAVRGGGHGAAGHALGLADGALVVDMSAMKKTEVDPQRRVATAEGGVLAGEYVKATFAHGLTTPLGDTPTVGLGGLILGGGMGHLARKHGLAIDHRRAVEIVLADGRIVRAILDGAVSRVPNDATAYAFRDRQLAVVVIAPYAEPAEAATHRAWADGLLAALRPAAAGVYSNFLDDEGPARVREAYPGLTWHRLTDVKRRYDPANLFRSNQNIVPAD